MKDVSSAVGNQLVVLEKMGWKLCKRKMKNETLRQIDMSLDQFMWEVLKINMDIYNLIKQENENS